jgi:FkbM family methyltransferase
MNIGLATLHFASKPCVKEVHSFEPFKRTYDRALSNFSLNPALASKIRPNNFGLAGADGETTVLIPDELNSGSFSIWGCGDGLKMQIELRNAASVFAEIIADAKEKHLDVVAKIDCEGSEFAVFQALETAGLLAEVSVFMVEWHRGFNKSHHDLVGPLLDAGFTVINHPGTVGNGFFYAIRSYAPTTSATRRGRGLRSLLPKSLR